jgi:spore germination cell wall hydrolase CwlJ-like protein
MTETPALPAPAPSRAWFAAPVLAGALVVGFLYAPEIGQTLSNLANPCATAIEKPDISRLLRGPVMGPEHDPDAVQPFFLHAANPAEQDLAVRCLTDALYYEAANEPVEGQRAVAQVVVNRVRDKHFPKSVCGVVYEGWGRRTGCQFSFVCDGSIRRRPADQAALDRLRPIAEAALNGYVVPEVGTATHYYATYVRPNWIRTVAEVAEIGKHVFCSWRGKAGLPTSLASSYGGGEFQVADAALNGVRKTASKVRITAHFGHSVLRGVSRSGTGRMASREGRRHERYA